eukprot:scaffold2367_cov58-Phaeocystis_antarctica.AAC.9
MSTAITERAPAARAARLGSPGPHPISHTTASRSVARCRSSVRAATNEEGLSLAAYTWSSSVTASRTSSTRATSRVATGWRRPSRLTSMRRIAKSWWGP